MYIINAYTIYVCIYKEGEGEKERETEREKYIYIYIYMYICMVIHILSFVDDMPIGLLLDCYWNYRYQS